jgi:hypothetical protein
VRHPQRQAEAKRPAWQHAYCRRTHDHHLLDDLAPEGALRALLSQSARDAAQSARTDFKNHRHQMD